MVRGIEPTEPLTGKDAEKFLKRLNRKPSKKDKQFVRECEEAYELLKSGSEF